MADSTKHSDGSKPAAAMSVTLSRLWTRMEDGNNMILKNEKFTISYNPVAGALPDDADIIQAFAQHLGGLVNGEAEPQEETALTRGESWYILLGDFRLEYQEAWPDWDKCLAVYKKHKAKYRSGWSTDSVDDGAAA